MSGGIAPTLRLPDFLIVGAQKAGTTWLQRALREHPQIYMPPRETAFFEDPEFGDGDLRRLSSTVTGAQAWQTIGIKRPRYLADPACPGRIAAALPQARIIVLLRDPVLRAISAYYHAMRVGLLPVRDPDAGLLDILAGRLPQPPAREVLSMGNYGEAICNYRRFFPSSQILIVLQSRLMKDSESVFSEVCQFLGVDHTLRPPALGDIWNEGLYARPVLVLVNHLSRRRFRYDLEHGRVFRGRGLGPFAAAVSLKAIDAVTTAFDIRGKPQVSRGVRMKLRDYYLPDIDMLEDLTGLDLSLWKLESC